jgi:hypothetical protein
MDDDGVPLLIPATESPNEPNDVVNNPNPNPNPEPKPATAENKPGEVDYWKEVELGVRSIFQRWTAIQMAIQHQWGGRNTKEKVEELIQIILEYLGNPFV